MCLLLQLLRGPGSSVALVGLEFVAEGVRGLRFDGEGCAGRGYPCCLPLPVRIVLEALENHALGSLVIVEERESKFQGGCHEVRDYLSCFSLLDCDFLVAVVAVVAPIAFSAPKSVVVAAHYMETAPNGAGSLAHLYLARLVSLLAVRALCLWRCGWHLCAPGPQMGEYS